MCGLEMRGRFALGPFHRLSPEQLRFVVELVKSRGNVYKVGEEIGVSYATARNRLNDIISAMGYDVEDEPPMPTPEERVAVLERLAKGEIKADEAVDLLKG
jgi:hypothetical protein